MRIRGRIKPDIKKKFKTRINDIILGLSRRVIVYKQPVKSECPNCYYDKFTDSSTGKCKWSAYDAALKQTEWETFGNLSLMYKYFVKGRCPVCKGAGYIETHRKRYINALIIWDPSSRGYYNQITFTPAGTEGSTVVLLKTDPKYYDIFRNCSKIIVDNIECKLAKPPVLRGLGNESVLVITAFTTEKIGVDDSEIIKDYK